MTIRTLLGIGCALGLFAAPAAAQPPGAVPSAPLSGEAARTAQDGRWVSLTGRVEDRSADTIVLRSGGHRLIVNVSAAEGRDLAGVGERVRISGRVDDGDPFERRTIEATRVTPLPES